jgi:hypothetical protein
LFTAAGETAALLYTAVPGAVPLATAVGIVLLPVA